MRDEDAIDVAALEDRERRPVVGERADAAAGGACAVHARVTSGGRSAAGDDAFAREEHRALDDVRELAHVAGELVALEHSRCTSGATRGDGRAQALGVAGDEVADEERDVAASARGAAARAR